MAGVEIGPVEGVCILGGGTAFPRHELSNAEVVARISSASPRRSAPSAEQLEFLAAGVAQNIGVRVRNWAHMVGTPLDHATEETTLDLAVAAARAALADAHLSADELAFIFCTTSTPHRMTSTLSAAVGAALGVTPACMDIRTGCSGGIFGLATAAQFLAAGTGPVLLIGTETFSKIIPPSHKVAVASLADGAGALILGRREGARLRSAYMRSDGSLARLISTAGALPPTAAEIDSGGYFLSGSPEELLEAIPAKYEEAIGHALARAGITAAAIDLYVPHQTSLSLIGEICRRVGIASEKAYINIAKHGNVGAAGWLVALVEARREGRCPPGSQVLVAAVGGGMSWAAAILSC